MRTVSPVAGRFVSRSAYGVLLTLLVSRAAHGDFVFTEILYDSASTPEGQWEFVELYNNGPTAVDLKDFVFDDNTTSPLSLPNIAGGVIPAHGFGVLYADTDDNRKAALNDAWLSAGAPPGHVINWIAVSNWPALNNTGDTLGLWRSIVDYGQGDFANAVAQITYDNGSGWPTANGTSSIYLTNLTADASVGSNWALSQSGLHGAWSSNAAGTNAGINVGSPNAIPEPSAWLLLGAVSILSVTAQRVHRAIKRRVSRKSKGSSTG